MNDSTDSIPLVSICCVTYNHEGFIEQCLDGFVIQQTTFPFEVLVHEDASTDNTAAIVRRYEAQYPQLFRCVYQSENQFSIQNTLTNILIPMSRGKYIALCEGDDYWTDPFKLQKQVDFLEKNSLFSICFHPVMILENGVLKADYITSVPSEESDIYALAKWGNYIHTPSVIYRKSFVEFPEEFGKSMIGDYFIYMLCAQYGKAKCLNEVMAVYRINSGFWSSLPAAIRAKQTTITFSLLMKYFSGKDDQVADIFFRRIEHYLSSEFAKGNNNEMEEILSVALSKKEYPLLALYSSLKEIYQPQSLLDSIGLKLLIHTIWQRLIGKFKKAFRRLGN